MGIPTMAAPMAGGLDQQKKAKLIRYHHRLIESPKQIFWTTD